MEKQKVSMIMPVFNSAPYLDHMLDSIYNQTYDNVELIIAYDNSNDGTLNILNNWKAKFDVRGYEYKIIRNNSRAGIVNGINNAMPYYTGDYITFPDSDDYMYPDFVEEMVKALNENPDYNWARCDNYKVIGRDISFDNNNIADFSSETEYGQEYDFGYDDRYAFLGSALNLLLYTIPRAPWRMMCRTSFLKEVLGDNQFFPHPSSHELPIALPLAAKEDFYYVPKPLYKYTIHKDGYYNSRTKNLHQMIPYLDSMEELAKECINYLDIDDSTKERYQLASRLYYCGTKAYYAKNLKADKLAEIYARNLNCCIKEFSDGVIDTCNFPYMIYWKYYFRLSAKIATGVKMLPDREKLNPDLWNQITNSKVILYGAGNNCKEVIDILKDQSIQIYEIWDKASETIGTRYGYKISQPQDGIDDDEIILITILDKKIIDEVKKDFANKGIKNVIDKEGMDLSFRYAMLKKYFPQLL